MYQTKSAKVIGWIIFLPAALIAAAVFNLVSGLIGGLIHLPKVVIDGFCGFFGTTMYLGTATMWAPRKIIGLNIAAVFPALLYAISIFAYVFISKSYWGNEPGGFWATTIPNLLGLMIGYTINFLRVRYVEKELSKVDVDPRELV